MIIYTILDMNTANASMCNSSPDECLIINNKNTNK